MDSKAKWPNSRFLRKLSGFLERRAGKMSMLYYNGDACCLEAHQKAKVFYYLISFYCIALMHDGNLRGSMTKV